MSTPTAVSGSTAIVRAGRFDASLRTRMIGRAESIPAPSWMAVLLEEGTADVTQGADSEKLDGPILVWRPWDGSQRLTLAAGSVGAYVLIGSTALANAVGYKPESRDLRDVADRRINLPLTPGAILYDTLRSSFGAVHRETRTDGPAARTLIEAHLRILLVEVWRSQGNTASGLEPRAPAQRIFSRFTTLVELHFRDRWTVARYAEALGLSRDRLGDICQRVRGRAPKEILDRRVALEARLLLEGSSNSVEQIAGLLGFQSAAQFNRFFHRTAGLPPGRFRTALARHEDVGETPLSQSLHDWP